MELFAKLFNSLLVLVYHCFDRIVIHGYLSSLSRPEQAVFFFHQVLGTPVVDKTVLSQRTNDYRNWVEAFARNHGIPIEWAAKGVRIEHGHHVFRAYWKNAFLKQYQKFSRFLRNQLCSNNLRDFGLQKGLDHLDAVRNRFQTITDRFAGFQAQCLNVQVDFPLLERIARPVTIGSGHDAILTTFQLSAKNYALKQLHYDLRKLKGHGLLERDGRRYAYHLTAKGVQVALLFLFFHKHLCGPLANSRFHHQPDPAHRPNSKLEAACHQADQAIQNIVDLLAAA